MQKPYISQPCHEAWNAMTQKKQGRFCDFCAKVVVDFTSKSDAEIVEYLQQHSKQKICGHFRNEQLHQTEKIEINLASIPTNLSFRKYFAIALLIAFASFGLVSCRNHKKELIGIVADVKELNKDSMQRLKDSTNSVLNDSINHSEMGEVAFTKDSVKPNHPLPPPPIKPKIEFVELTTKGEMEIIPIKEDTTRK